jgi:DNA-binding XRE family transcriptional regulator
MAFSIVDYAQLWQASGSVIRIKTKNPHLHSARLLTLAAVSEETERILAELRAWAEAERGRSAELAQFLGVTRGAVTRWLKGESVPSWEHGLKIAAFLEEQRRRRPNPPPAS